MCHFYWYVQLVPADDLKKEIDAWIDKQIREYKAKRDAEKRAGNTSMNARE